VRPALGHAANRTSPLEPEFLSRGLVPTPARLARWVSLALLTLFALAALQAWLALRPGLQSLTRLPPLGAMPETEPVAGPTPLAPGTLSRAFTPEVQAWAPAIQRWSAAYGLDPNLVATVMQIESCGHPTAVSSAGARGLFQVMPFHFAPGEDPLDPDTNALRGLSYLAGSFDLAQGRLDLALAGYNGGHGVISRPPAAWPTETQRYAYWGTGILADIETGAVTSPRLQQWLEAGGASLCRRAGEALGLGS